jgi:flagellar biosynthetic protein FliQ
MDPLRLAIDALATLGFVAGPLLLASLVAGVGIGIAQTVTQINEQSLSFLVKVIAVAAVLVVMGSGLAGSMATYTRRCFTGIEKVVR